MNRKQIMLSTEQRIELEKFTKTGVRSARLIKRAKVILLLDTSQSRKAATFAEIGEQEGVSNTTITKIKNDFIAATNVSAFLKRNKRITPPVEPKMTGAIAAHIIALACSKAPEGYARWTLKLLADKSIELDYIDSISDMSIHRLLKKHNLSLT